MGGEWNCVRLAPTTSTSYRNPGPSDSALCATTQRAFEKVRKLLWQGMHARRMETLIGHLALFIVLLNVT